MSIHKDISNVGDRNDLVSGASGATTEGSTVGYNSVGAVAAPSPSAFVDAPESSTAALELKVSSFRETEKELRQYREIFDNLDKAKIAAATASEEYVGKNPDKNLQIEIKNSSGIGMEIFGKVSQLPIHELAGSSVLMGFATDFSKLKANNPSLAGKSKRTLRDEYSPKQEEQYLPVYERGLKALTREDDWVTGHEVREFVANMLVEGDLKKPAAGSPYYPNYSGGMSLIDKFMKDGEFTSTISLMAKFGDCKKQYVAKGDGRVAVFQVNVLSSETVDSFTF